MKNATNLFEGQNGMISIIPFFILLNYNNTKNG